MMKAEDRICVGAFLGAHGVRGQVRLASYTDDPLALFSYVPLTDEAGARVFALTPRGEGRDCFLASVKGVATREAALALKGIRLYAARSAFPLPREEEYYHADLIGLRVCDERGGVLGAVVDVHDYGAGAFLEIKPEKAKSFMLPFKTMFVPRVDLVGGVLEVIVPEGWLSSEKAVEEKKKRTRHKGSLSLARGGGEEDE